MRLADIAFAALALSSCATAVYDSLDRRGVDATDILKERITSVRDNAAAAKTSLTSARGALAKIKGLDGPALANQLDRAKAAGQDASTAAQQFRLSLDSARAAGTRYLSEKNEDLKFLDDTALQAARVELNNALKEQGAFFSAATGASLRLSPALTLYANEISKLRTHPTSSAFAAARTNEIDTAVSSVSDALTSLNAVTSSANAAIAATK
ncbi:MAG: DUF2959 family protein [Parvularculaceae bacterium]